ncbi:hypothetical protein [Chitinophaga sp. LS1]|uniref:hypothetical protein n=1 Tax=Chitinophaga sp. LS1 TaxID=3051176 RepID=UPI002AAB1945|nr:hypothetical protein [Chitinophaga sp. LS1]WPV65954.1 hypothetical protein QQL36_29575 [Chitinophaga sp. LS1]
MRFLYTLIHLYIFSFLLNPHAVGQNRKVIEYDFKTQEFNGILPFDQPFDIKVKNLDAEVASFEVTIQELKKVDYKRIGKSELQLNDLLSASNQPRFSSGKLVRGKDFMGNTAVVVIGAFLEPNSKYFIKVEGETGRIDIPREEKEKVVQAVMANKDFQKIIDAEADSRIKDPDGMSNDILKHSKMITDIANKEAKVINPNYEVADTSYQEQFIGLADISTTFSNISDDINTAKGNIYNRLAIDLNKEIDVLRKSLKQSKAKLKKEKNPKAIKELTSENAIASKVIVDGNKLVDTYKELSKKFKNEENNIFTDNETFFKKLQDVNWATFEKEGDEGKKVENLINSELESTFKNEKSPVRIDFAGVKAIEQEAIERINSELFEFEKKKNETIEKVGVQIEAAIFAHGQTGSTYPMSTEDHLKLHVTLDLGYAYVGQIDRGNLYAGMNIYFRAIDTSLPLKNYRRTFKDIVGSRLSLLLGISLQNIDQAGVRRGLIDNSKALVTGMGVRLLPWFKVNTGAYLYYKYPSNPLENKNKMTFTGSPFVSLSIDFNLSKFLGSFGNGQVAKIFTP